MHMKTHRIALSSLAFSLAFAFDACAAPADFLARVSEIRAEVEKQAASMDATFDFNSLAVNDMLPPVLGRSDGASIADLAKPCGSGSSSCSFSIIDLERSLCQPVGKAGSCRPLTWRDIVFDSLPDTASAQADESATHGTQAAQAAQADLIFGRNMDRLGATYTGMVLYRHFQKMGLLR